MARWSTHRTDGNADALRTYLEAHGAQVHVIDRPLDWLVSGWGVTAIAEVKRAKQPLRASQEAFLARYAGLWAILTTERDCDALLGVLRRLAASTRLESVSR